MSELMKPSEWYLLCFPHLKESVGKVIVHIQQALTDTPTGQPVRIRPDFMSATSLTDDTGMDRMIIHMKVEESGWSLTPHAAREGFPDGYYELKPISVSKLSGFMKVYRD